MKKGSNRRTFLKTIGMGGIGASIVAGISLETNAAGPGKTNKKVNPNKPDSGNPHRYNESYEGTNLSKVAFPLGGIGAGMFCLEGTGAVSHMSIRNRPELTNEPAMFAAIAIKGIDKGAKVLEGPVPDWKAFGHKDYGTGGFGATYGLPRFQNCSFEAKFPSCHITLSDEDLPVEVRVTGWSPFIPGDAENSGLPVGVLEYEFKNKHNSAIDAVFSYNSRNFVPEHDQKGVIKPLTGGFILSHKVSEDKPSLQTDFGIFTDETNATVDHCWFRGGWFDPLTIVWNTIKEGKMKSVEPVEEGAPGASFYVPFPLAPGGTKKIRVMMAWYSPESELHFGETGDEEACDPSSGCCSSPDELGLDPGGKSVSTTYKPWYSGKFKSLDEVIQYWEANQRDLYDRTMLFQSAFHASTLPPEVMEAIGANLTILKSPTVMRQYDGRLWNWEGLLTNGGCCHGSCTHVWNYAQAIPHLFPALERSLRHTEFCENQNQEGHQAFRANLPISPLKHNFHSAADGQLGGIMKVYREWRISGDNVWLKKMYPMAKKSMDYCINAWDPRLKGVVEEPHHNTYDIEFWGPNGMITSFYLGALAAIQKMGKQMNDNVSKYKSLYEKGKKYMEDNLFDGEYFIQDIQWTGLSAPDPVKAQSFNTKYSDEALEILKKEGPKYQYGKGCLSDGVLGCWIARMCGLEDPVDRQKISSHVQAVHKYNLKRDLTDHINPQRPGFALGKEGGLLLCSWPKGEMLSLPFVYSNEVWTGIEYHVASHLMMMGEVEKALEIVRTCRDRYDGTVRNPFNEYECGSWYARAMSSYGMIQGLTGLWYDAVEKALFIDSKIGDFTCFLSTEKGFGTVSLRQGKPSLDVVYGEIAVQKVFVSGKASKLS